MTKPHFFSRDWDRRERRLTRLAEALDAWHKKNEKPEPPVHRRPTVFSFEDHRRMVADFLYSWSIGVVKIKFASSQIERDFRDRVQFLAHNPSAPEAQVRGAVHWMLRFLVDGRFDGAIQGVTKKAPIRARER